MANLIGRYVWLVDLLRRYDRLSYEEINEKWQQSGLNIGDDFALRTFHNHRTAIADIFDIDIVCDIHDGYKYYIEDIERLQGDSLRSWIIDSYSVLNQVQADRKLEGRIIFENIPSGNNWLTIITNAIRQNKVIRITHQGFSTPKSGTYEIEPYYLKVVKRRWYVIGRNPYYSDRNKQKNKEDGNNRQENVYLVYALDRISAVEIIDKIFDFKHDFCLDEYFKGCLGVIPSDGKLVRVVIKTHGLGSNLLRTLPLHESQRELLSKNDEAEYFEYHVCPNYDFYQALLMQGAQVEVVEPPSVREVMHNFARRLMDYYK